MVWFHDTNICDYEVIVREAFVSVLFSFSLLFSLMLSPNSGTNQAVMLLQVGFVCFWFIFLIHLLSILSCRGICFIRRIFSWCSFFEDQFLSIPLVCNRSFNPWFVASENWQMTFSQMLTSLLPCPCLIIHPPPSGFCFSSILLVKAWFNLHILNITGICVLFQKWSLFFGSIPF